MLELLLLLLPLAAASGWLAARRSAAKREKQQKPDISPTYFQGLNYLLNEQPDKAIDLFIKMLEVDSDTVETHLALGNLFRRRGEVERAIRIHQNLIARPSLSREQRAQALLQLGLDYMRAGLFDRAENLFIELTEIRLYSEQALSNLLEIYQQEKDWVRCLEIAGKLGPGHNGNLKTQTAHFYCELAQLELKQHNKEQAEKFIRKAQSVDRNCVRATMLQADMEQMRGDYRAAVKSYKRVEEQDNAYLPEIIPQLLTCYQQLNRKQELRDYLLALYARSHNPDVMLALTEKLIEDEGEQAGFEFLLEHLAQHPDLKVLDRLVGLNMSNAQRHPQETLQVFKDALGKLMSAQPAYQCENCGFQVKRLHWQCPSCKGWGSIKPVQGLGHGSC
jgi:lipopolysaccharide biosynthesis regulator YciM